MLIQFSLILEDEFLIRIHYNTVLKELKELIFIKS
jgi:hypothetical protein